MASFDNLMICYLLVVTSLAEVVGASCTRGIHSRSKRSMRRHRKSTEDVVEENISNNTNRNFASTVRVQLGAATASDALKEAENSRLIKHNPDEPTNSDYHSVNTFIVGLYRLVIISRLRTIGLQHNC